MTSRGSVVGSCMIALAAVTLGRGAAPAPTRTIDLGGGVKMEFVLIAPGRFLMGSPPDIGDGDEKPQHAVTLTQPYYFGKYEVTQRQWQAVMGENPSHFRGADLPVDSVSWMDCQRFLALASSRSGVRLVLPTEAQWEYACRAGTTTRWSCGNDEAQLAAYAWIDRNARGATHEVGTVKPNAWGLYDMCGNVAEWCADWYANPYPDGTAVDPRGAASGTARVLRGGNASDIPSSATSAARNCMGPSESTPGTGLRCVLLIDADDGR